MYLRKALCAVVYWAFGFAFAFGDGNWFIGYNYWLLLGATREQWSKWFFHFAFAATSCTIVSGAVVERVQFGPFAIFLFVTGGLTYPVASHWVWSNVGKQYFHPLLLIMRKETREMSSSLLLPALQNPEAIFSSNTRLVTFLRGLSKNGILYFFNAKYRIE